MTPRLRQPGLSLPKQIPIQLLLYNTVTCLMQPATTFFCPPNEKKACLKQPLQNFTQQKNGKIHMETMHKNKCLPDYIYYIAAL